jgi:uncharacterized protein
MPASDKLLQRIAVISDLVSKAPPEFGRTALMKCLYFLQTIRGVPLGYRFRLYTYGPFDPDVLNDLSLAERLGAVDSHLQSFSGGYRYELARGTDAGRVSNAVRDFLNRYQDDIDWVVQVFGGRSALDLENASTVLFTDRSVSERGERITLRELVHRVHEVKPHLAIHVIEREARSLKEQGLIITTT